MGPSAHRFRCATILRNALLSNVTAIESVAMSSNSSSRAAVMHAMTATVARRWHCMMMSIFGISRLEYVIAQ